MFVVVVVVVVAAAYTRNKSRAFELIGPKILKDRRQSVPLTVNAGSLFGAEGFSTKELPEGSSTTMVNGNSESIPALMRASRAITPAICAPTFRAT